MRPEVGTIWVKGSDRAPYTRYRVLKLDGTDVYLKRCDMLGNILKGARFIKRQLGAFTSNFPTYVLAPLPPLGTTRLKNLIERVKR